MTHGSPRLVRPPSWIVILIILAAFQPEPAEAQDIESLRTAAEQGDANAQFTVGHKYDAGDSVPENDREAVRWYQMAAEQGHAAAQFALGAMYAKGEGVAKDYVNAYVWVNLAVAQGHSGTYYGDDGDVEGTNLKDWLRERMSAEEVTAGQKLSSELWESIGRRRNRRGEGRVYRIGSGIINPVPIVQTTPSYTDAAIKAKVEGLVQIQAIVRKDGRLDSFKVIRGLGHGLDEQAVQELKTNWRFRPGLLGRSPVDVLVTIEVRFGL